MDARMRGAVRRHRSIFVSALVLSFALAGTAFGAAAGTAFKLGVVNSISAMTQLVGSTPNAMLRVSNNGSGPALDLRVDSNRPALAINRTAKIANLNADLLDGKDRSFFQKRVARTCAVGSTIRAINADGTVACAPDNDTVLRVRTTTPPEPNATFWDIKDFVQPAGSAISTLTFEASAIVPELCVSGVNPGRVTLEISMDYIEVAQGSALWSGPGSTVKFPVVPNGAAGRVVASAPTARGMTATITHQCDGGQEWALTGLTMDAVLAR